MNYSCDKIMYCTVGMVNQIMMGKKTVCSSNSEPGAVV